MDEYMTYVMLEIEEDDILNKTAQLDASIGVSFFKIPDAKKLENNKTLLWSSNEDSNPILSEYHRSRKKTKSNNLSAPLVKIIEEDKGTSNDDVSDLVKPLVEQTTSVLQPLETPDFDRILRPRVT